MDIKNWIIKEDFPTLALIKSTEFLPLVLNIMAVFFVFRETLKIELSSKKIFVVLFEVGECITIGRWWCTLDAALSNRRPWSLDYSGWMY